MQRCALVAVVGMVAAEDNQPKGIVFNMTDAEMEFEMEQNAKFEKEFEEGNYHSTTEANSRMAHCGQACDEWCWATSATMSASVFGGGSNCGQNEAKIAGNRLGRSCDTSCSNQCNQPGSGQDIINGIRLLSGKTYQLGGVLSQQQLDSALQGGPVVMLVRWNGGGGHAVTVEGVSGGRYSGYNPWPPTSGESFNVQYSGLTNFQNKGRWTQSVYTSGGGPGPSPPSPYPSSCQDAQGFRTSDGSSCQDFEYYQYCTSNGRTGPGWNSQWGQISQWVDGYGRSAFQACCACGGGNRGEELAV